MKMTCKVGRIAASTKTLYINYIRDADNVIYTGPSVTGDSGLNYY